MLLKIYHLFFGRSYYGFTDLMPLSPGAQQAKFGSNDSICMRYMNHVTILHMTMLCQPPKKISWGGKHVPGLGEPHVMYERCRLTK